MVRVITQETFEAAVKENIEEFGQTPEEAIEDAVQQFQAQGVDLSNIIKELILTDGNSPKIIETLNSIKTILDGKQVDKSELNNLLKVFKDECDKDIAHKLMASKENAYNPLLTCLNRFNDDKEVLLSSLKAMYSLMDGQPDLLDRNGVETFIGFLDNQNDEDIIIMTLKWITACCLKHEKNRQLIFKLGILNHLKRMMEQHKNPEILTELCSVLRNLVLDDDVRVEYGNAHEHARLIATETLQILTQLLSNFKSDEKFVGDILLTLAMVIVRNEFCQILDEAGGLKFILDVMVEFHDKEKIIRQCYKLLKALAGNDVVKRNIIKHGAATLICSTLNIHKNELNSAANGLSCISALALRDTENSKALFDTGLAEIICQCMNVHANNLNVQRNASWAIRNIVAKCPEHRGKFLELNAEILLNRALEKFGNQAGHDIKCALNDLGCNVKLTEQWTGKGGKIYTSENIDAEI